MIWPTWRSTMWLTVVKMIGDTYEDDVRGGGHGG